jgi:phosphoglycerate-specific signal transduction histidine kinase
VIDFDGAKPGNIFAYYPNETPLFEGAVLVSDFEGDKDVGHPTARVEVEADRSFDIAIAKRVQEPFRTQYGGYFLNRASDLFVCNVDLERIEQPSQVMIAKALLGTMAPAGS